VDPGGGAGFEICSTACQTAALGGDGFGYQRPYEVAIGPNGIVYAGDNLTRRQLHRFDFRAADASEMMLTTLVEPPIFARGMEVDPDDDHLHVASVLTAMLELEPVASKVVSQHFEEALSGARGYGRNAVSGDEYLAYGNSLLVATESGAPPAIVEVPHADRTGPDTASLRAEVTPNGPANMLASGHFEISPDGVAWAQAGDQVPLGDGVDPLEVSAVVSGLDSGVRYKVRFVAFKPYDNPPVKSPVAEIGSGAPEGCRHAGDCAGPVPPRPSPPIGADVSSPTHAAPSRPTPGLVVVRRPRRRVVHGGRLRLVVEGRRPGRATARATVRFKGLRPAGRGTVEFARPGARVLWLRLNGLARRLIARRGRIRVTITVQKADVPAVRLRLVLSGQG
jgi:hypothetical protein